MLLYHSCNVSDVIYFILYINLLAGLWPSWCIWCENVLVQASNYKSLDKNLLASLVRNSCIILILRWMMWHWKSTGHPQSHIDCLHFKLEKPLSSQCSWTVDASLGTEDSSVFPPCASGSVQTSTERCQQDMYFCCHLFFRKVRSSSVSSA